jgi:hypothetical protein
VKPGKSGDSSLIKLITSTDPDVFMPPKGDRLKQEQIERLKRWIDNGAPFSAGAGGTSTAAARGASAVEGESPMRTAISGRLSQ